MGLLDNMLIQGAGSLLGGITGLIQQGREQDWSAQQAQISRNFQSLEADKARDWNESMWNKQNEYNTPLSQYQRLRELGINDASIMGMMSGNGAAGNASSVATQAAPAGAMAAGQGSIAGALGNYISDIPKTAIQNAVQSEDYFNRKIQNEIAEQTKQDLITMAHMNVDEAQNRINLLISQCRTQEQQRQLMIVQTEMVGLEKEQFEACMRWNIKLAKANYKLAKVNIDKVDAEIALLLAQEGKIPSEIALNMANAYKATQEGNHAGDKSFEQWVTGEFGPELASWLRGEEGSDKGVLGVPSQVGKAMGEGMAARDLEREYGLPAGWSLSPSVSLADKAEYAKLAGRYLKGDIDIHQYISGCQRIYVRSNPSEKQRLINEGKWLRNSNRTVGANPSLSGGSSSGSLRDRFQRRRDN